MLTQTVSRLDSGLLQKAKKAFTTRRVPCNAIATLLQGSVHPQAGDLVLARVESIEQHKTIHLDIGRKSSLFVGDEIIVCYGNRYAPDQFEAFVPADLSPCHLVAAGGLAGIVQAQNTQMDLPTQITPLGLVGDHAGRRINIADWALPSSPPRDHQPSPQSYHPQVLVVVGSAMNAGKTTMAAHLIYGLVSAGYRVNAGKITGTGAGGDLWLMEDAGAAKVLDFCDAGFPTTYRITAERLERLYQSLLGHLRADHPDFVVLEIADGLYQDETAALLKADYFRQSMGGLFFAARGALDAAGGLAWLQQHDLQPLALSGLVAASPLAMRETALATGLRALTLEELRSKVVLAEILQDKLPPLLMAPQVTDSQFPDSQFPDPYALAS
jgi:hypothetical protein